MTEFVLRIQPFAFHAEADPPRLVLDFDDTDENRRFAHLVFEAALEGEPMVLRPTLEAEHQLLKQQAIAAEQARVDALERVDAAELRERQAREQLADAEREMAKLKAAATKGERLGVQTSQVAASGRSH